MAKQKTALQKINWRMVRENTSFRNAILTSELRDGKVDLKWEKCRPIPQADDWFENVWHNYRDGVIYE